MLNIRRRASKGIPARVNQALIQPENINGVWSIYFMRDRFWDGRKYRLLNIIDDYHREVLSIELDTRLRTMRVIRVHERLELT